MTKKYIILVAIFILGLIITSDIKNKTRDIQKRITVLNKDILDIKKFIYESKLDYDVITSPQRILNLANDYLEPNYTPYKLHNIKSLELSELMKINKIKVSNINAQK